ncbi:MAG: 7-carboxy-7-deazaguanine synthase QueE [Methanobrevibacter sp.]|nr:7-carboxy-7-deazaguanine synthase QueE [Methanobrevibacter sp.]
MKAPIVEIFSSFQGEGAWIGRRQIFIRFSGCNLSCNYCDTQESQSKDFGTLMTVDEILEDIKNLISPDLHSISFTGGEPLLYVEFINKLIEKIKFSEFGKINIKFMLETNGTLPESLAKLVGIDCVSLDIKLPEHFDDEKTHEDIFENEIKSLKFLINHNKELYCKMVVLPSSKTSTIKNMINKIMENVESKLDIMCVIQPSSPLSQWTNQNKKLFVFSEIIGECMEVLLIPQTHKLLNIK